jgi:hypothetical protein
MTHEEATQSIITVLEAHGWEKTARASLTPVANLAYVNDASIEFTADYDDQRAILGLELSGDDGYLQISVQGNQALSDVLTALVKHQDMPDFDGYKALAADWVAAAGSLEIAVDELHGVVIDRGNVHRIADVLREAFSNVGG